MERKIYKGERTELQGIVEGFSVRDEGSKGRMCFGCEGKQTRDEARKGCEMRY